MLHFKTKVVALAISLSLVFKCAPSTLANPTSDDSEPSQAQCLEMEGKLFRRTPMNAAEWKQMLALNERCQTRFWALPDPNTPLPTANECINFLSLTLNAFRDNNVKELETISARQGRSLSRCRELIDMRYIPSESMDPTLQVNDRLFVDKSVYRSQLPQRGDIIISSLQKW